MLFIVLVNRSRRTLGLNRKPPRSTSGGTPRV